LQGWTRLAAAVPRGFIQTNTMMAGWMREKTEKPLLLLDNCITTEYGIVMLTYPPARTNNYVSCSNPRAVTTSNEEPRPRMGLVHPGPNSKAHLRPCVWRSEDASASSGGFLACNAAAQLPFLCAHSRKTTTTRPCRRPAPPLLPPVRRRNDPHRTP
jgi:hypothetical protein